MTLMAMGGGLRGWIRVKFNKDEQNSILLNPPSSQLAPPIGLEPTVTKEGVSLASCARR
jgi:hypothetical protein